MQEDVAIITEAVYGYAEHVVEEMKYGVQAARDGTYVPYKNK